MRPHDRELVRGGAMGLKLCPFCGGRGHAAYDERTEPKYAWIFCTQCRAKTRSFSDAECDDPVQAAADAWNARAGKKRDDGNMEPMESRYGVGMYGGKFLPPHIGHARCIDVCCGECEEPHIILFVNGADEERVRPSYALSPEDRLRRIRAYTLSKHPHARIHMIDVSAARDSNGAEDWDAETPIVRAILPRIDAIYSSEPSYGPYFARAYPEAIHRLVDPGREVIRISGTAIRSMEPSEARKWMS